MSSKLMNTKNSKLTIRDSQTKTYNAGDRAFYDALKMKDGVKQGQIIIKR